jgi:hypothetical protein
MKKRRKKYSNKLKRRQVSSKNKLKTMVGVRGVPISKIPKSNIKIIIIGTLVLKNVNSLKKIDQTKIDIYLFMFIVL